MQLLFSHAAQQDRKYLSPDVEKRIIEKLDQYRRAPNPFAFAKRLHDDPEGTHRFQIGDWRTKFFVKKDVIVITRIRHRSNAYR